MHQPGKVDVRPLVEMTGHALFNEVFMEEAVVPDAAMIGGLNNGWAVANTTLMNERAGLGSGGGHAAASAATPGHHRQATSTSAPATSCPPAARPGAAPEAVAGARWRRGYKLLVDLAKGNGKAEDPRHPPGPHEAPHPQRAGPVQQPAGQGGQGDGQDMPGLPNISKLAMSDIVRTQRDLGLSILGPLGTLHAYKPRQQRAGRGHRQPVLGIVTGMALFAQGPPIYGGTDQIQKNIIGERVLGLPKEANNDKTAAFKELPKNA